MIMINYFRNILLLWLILLLSACGTSPKTNFYLLSADNAMEGNTPDEVSIGVWKVSLPELIDRPEIVTRTGPYTIDLADFHRWAGGLRSNINLLLANELSHNLKTGHVDISPWSSYRQFDYQIKVHVRKFDGSLGGESQLEGVYIILNGKGDKKLFEDTFMLKENVKGKSYNNMAEAMSQLVINLSAKIAKSIEAQKNSLKK